MNNREKALRIVNHGDFRNLGPELIASLTQSEICEVLVNRSAYLDQATIRLLAAHVDFDSIPELVVRAPKIVMKYFAGTAPTYALQLLALEFPKEAHHCSLFLWEDTVDTLVARFPEEAVKLFLSLKPHNVTALLKVVPGATIRTIPTLLSEEDIEWSMKHHKILTKVYLMKRLTMDQAVRFRKMHE